MATFGILIWFGVLSGLVLLLFGWITPLTTGLILRRAPLPRSKPWLIAGTIWGVLSLLLAAGLVITVIVLTRSFRSEYGESRVQTSAFDAKSFEGPTMALTVPEGMTVTMKVSLAGEEKEVNRGWNMESHDGSLIVPAAPLQMHTLTISRRDTAGVEWRLGSDWRQPVFFNPASEKAPWLDRFRADLTVTSSQLDDDLSASLQFADETGRRYELEAPCGRPEYAQSIELLNADGEQILSGRFAFS